MRIAVILVVAIAASLLVSCAPTPEPAPYVPPKQVVLKGVSISPQSDSPADFRNFFVKARECCQFVTWSGDWAEVRQDNTAPDVITQVAQKNGLKTIILPTFHSNGRLLRPLDETNKADYKAKIVDYVRVYRPDFVGLGVEVNLLSREDLDVFIPFFNETVLAVHNASPKTRVFVSFQLEKIRGRNDGLFGGNVTEDNWRLLNEFRSADLFAFTSYPGLIYKDPGEIPDDYYLEMKNFFSKPFAFSELGWQRDGPAGWESSADEQARFIYRFKALTGKMSSEFIVWSFLYDPPSASLFGSMGLLPRGQNSSAAWEYWKSSYP